ncbi:ATP-binding protein OS=Streptomyces aurantiogriseus OX=66870 GN=GCM10010251_16150 PE=4 SV=1 [Streptomyces aurantiogriseus]
MKQSAAKTLGVAALGVAFAAAGAGAANAAPAVLDDAQVLSGVQSFPAQGDAANVLPGADRALDQAQPTLVEGLTSAQPVAEKVLSQGQAKGLIGMCRPARACPRTVCRPTGFRSAGGTAPIRARPG